MMFPLKTSGEKGKNTPQATRCGFVSELFKLLLGLCRWLRPSHVIAQPLEPLYELTLHLGAVILLEKLRSLLLILLPRGHQVVVDHQNAVAHRQRGPFTASPFL